MNLALVFIHLAAICVCGLPAANAHVALVRSERDHVSKLSPISPFTADSREGLLVAKLIELEHHFEPEGSRANTTGDGNGPEEHQGADRMDPHQHNYGPAYANYLSELGDDLMRGLSVPSHAQSTNAKRPEGGSPKSRNHPVYAKYLTKLASLKSLESLSPTIVEVGILTGSGLAMWNSLFPKSRIYGFDIDTGPYLRHVASYKKLGFNDASTQVQLMDERADNSRMFAESLGSAKANIVVDDGDHSPESTTSVLNSISKSLADKFVYFIEDVAQDLQDAYLRHMSKGDFSKACLSCEIEVIPSVGNLGNDDNPNPQGMIVISRL